MSRRDPPAERDRQHHGGPARSFASEVTRVAREVATEGKLGGQAQVQGGGHLEGFDRQRQHDGCQPDEPGGNIAEVTTAVANGDLSKKITVDVAARSWS